MLATYDNSRQYLLIKSQIDFLTLVRRQLSVQVKENLGLVRQQANRLLWRGLEFEDLVNEGYFGLVEAIKRFDPSRGNKFSTYAVWWIRNFQLRGIAQSRSIYLPDSASRVAKQVKGLTGEGLSLKEVAELLDKSLKYVTSCYQGTQPVASFSAYSNAEEIFTEEVPQVSTNKAIELLRSLGEEITEIVLMRMNGLTYKRIGEIVGQTSKANKACYQDSISYLKQTLNPEVLEELQTENKTPAVATPPRSSAPEYTNNSRLNTMICNFRKESKSRGRLTREQEYGLIVQVQKGSQRALRQLIEANKSVIMSAANRCGPGVDKQALVCAGEAAVDKAAKEFDITKATRFITYFVHVLVTEVQARYCDETGISREISRNLKSIAEASALLSHTLDRDPNIEEIALKSSLSRRQILNAWEVRNFAQPASLNEVLAEDSELQLQDLQVDETTDPWDFAERAESLDTLQLLETSGNLEPRQVNAVLDRAQGYSAKEIGEKIGVGAERVRQLIKGVKRTMSDFKAGLIDVELPELVPVPVPVSVSMPKPVAPIIPRLNASRLGGRIGRIVQQAIAPIKAQFEPVNCPLLSEGHEGGVRLSPGLTLESACEDKPVVLPFSEGAEDGFSLGCFLAFCVGMFKTLFSISTTVHCSVENLTSSPDEYARGPTL